MAIDHIDYDGADAVITTRRPHHRTGPDASGKYTSNVLLSGVLEEVVNPTNQQKSWIDTVFNRPYPVTAKLSETQLKIKRPAGAPADSSALRYVYALIGPDFHGGPPGGGVAEGNVYFDCAETVYTDTGTIRDVVVRDEYYSGVFRSLLFDFNPSPPDPPNPNNPAPGGMEDPRLARTGVNLASLSYITSAGPVYTATAVSATPHGLVSGETVNISGARVGNAPAPANSYDGDRMVTVTNAYSFTYTMPSDPTGNADTPSDPNPIRVGIYCLKRDANNPKVAVLETASAHHLKVGDVVRIFGATRNTVQIEFPEGTYCDIVSVLQLLSPTKFTYEMQTAPDYDPDASNSFTPITFQSRYQVHRLVCERNVFDLYPLDSNSAFPPSGMATIAYQDRQFYMFTHAVIRENLFRHSDGEPGALLPVPTLPGYQLGSRALRASSFDATLFDRNLVDVSDPHPIHYLRTGALTGFANQTASGKRLPIQEDINGGGVQEPFENQDSLDSKVQDALVLALL